MNFSENNNTNLEPGPDASFRPLASRNASGTGFFMERAEL